MADIMTTIGGRISGPVDLGGQTFINPVLSGINGDPSSPLVLINGKLVAAQILNSHNISLNGLEIIADDVATPVPQLTGKALIVRGSSHISVVNNLFRRAMIGAEFIDTTDVLFDANETRELRRDGVHFVNCERVRATRNYMHGWQTAAGDHPDGFQAWNDKLGHAADGHVIEDNCIHRDGGGVPQGIFYRNYPPAQFPGYTGFVNLQVRRNLVIGCLGNGITLDGATAAVCQDNEVWMLGTDKSWINVLPDAVRGGNKSSIYHIGGKFPTAAEVQAAGDSIVPAINATEEAALVVAWRARVFGASVPAPSPDPAQIDPPIDPVPDIPSPPVVEIPPVSEPTPVPVLETPPVPPLTAEQKAMVLSAVATALDGLG